MMLRPLSSATRLLKAASRVRNIALGSTTVSTPCPFTAFASDMAASHSPSSSYRCGNCTRPASSVARKCSWISVRPSSCTSTGPLTVSTSGIPMLLPGSRCGGKPIGGGRSVCSRAEARVTGPLAAAIEQHAEEHAADGDEERDDQPDEERPVDALPIGRAERKGERKHEGHPPPLAGSGEAEDEAGEEEDQVGGDVHSNMIPVEGREQPMSRRGTEESNLERRFWRPPCSPLHQSPRDKRRPSLEAREVHPSFDSFRPSPNVCSLYGPLATRREPRPVAR